MDREQVTLSQFDELTLTRFGLCPSYCGSKFFMVVKTELLIVSEFRRRLGEAKKNRLYIPILVYRSLHS